MFNYLDNKLIKNQGTTKAVEVSGVIGITLNILLFITKVIIGIISGSITIISDAINNLIDSLNSIIIIVGNHFAQKPADRDHPFGHGRIEYITGLIISLIIFVVGYELLRSSIDKIINPEPVKFSFVSLIILIILTLIKALISAFNYYLNNKYDSLILKGSYEDSRNDILVTLISIVSFIFDRKFPISIDGILGVLVSLFIFYTAINLIKETSSVLIGENEEIAEDIKKDILKNKRILELHDLYIHRYGTRILLGMCDVVVDRNENFIEIHELIDEIEDELYQKYKIKFSMHIDPSNEVDKFVLEEIKKINPVIKIHDFKIDSIKKIVSFDIVCPWEYDLNDKDKNRLKENLKNHYSDYEIKIHVDKDDV